MTTRNATFRVAALYRFTAFPDFAALRAPLAAICKANGVRGTLLLASEGINGTIAGTDGGVEAVLEHIRNLPGCAALEVKNSFAETMPFHRMKVRLKKEIVTMGVTGIDPVGDAGTYVAPEDWNALILSDDVVVIDTRNGYEVGIGTFAGAINPQTESFRDFPGWFRENRETLTPHDTPKKVAMFCTGGIRCEKATAFLRSEGVEEVYHLKGGILNYLERIGPAESLWQGECFVFDQRVAVGHSVLTGSYDLCHACRMPVSESDKASPHYKQGISCPACHADRDESQRQRYAERQHQMELARKRGVEHIGSGIGTS